MIVLYQSHTYSDPSGPNFTSTGRKLWLLDAITGPSGLSVSAKPAPSSFTSSVQTALLRYPPRISLPCHALGQCALPTNAPPLFLRMLPLGQMRTGMTSLRLGTSAGPGYVIELLLPAMLIGSPHSVKAYPHGFCGSSSLP